MYNTPHYLFGCRAAAGAMRHHPQFPGKFCGSDAVCVAVDAHAYGQQASGGSAGKGGDIEMSMPVLVRFTEPAAASLYYGI
eukprot:159047-Rhodomonas_salina.2